MSRKLPLILYHNCCSPPSRMALLAVRNLGLDIEVKNVDIYKGEQNTPEFLKINPLHQVPTLVHEDFVLTESRAIMMYIASLIESPMYPQKDLKKRALVDSRLFFDATNCFDVVKNFARPVLRSGVKKIPPAAREGIKTLLSTLDSFLYQSEWFAGNELTLADLAILASVGTIKCINKKFSATLYCNIHGVPSRMVLLTVRNLDLDIELRYIDVFKGEQNTPEFIKINPLHQIPVLHIAGENNVLTESRAIMMHLTNVTKSSLYPTDLKKRSLVDSRLFYDATTAYPAVKQFEHQTLRVGVKKIPSEVRENLNVVLNTLETFLVHSEWFAGDELTLADLAYLASIETVKCWGANFNDYPRLNDWYERCRPLPGFTENHEGARKLAEKLAKMLDEPLWK